MFYTKRPNGPGKAKVRGTSHIGSRPGTYRVRSQTFVSNSGRVDMKDDNLDGPLPSGSVKALMSMRLRLSAALVNGCYA